MGGIIPGAKPIPTGSAALPGLPFVADSDTGIYYPAGGGFAVSINGLPSLSLSAAAMSFFVGAVRALNLTNANTAIGYATLDSITSGTLNTAVGVNALTGCTTGYQNVAVGYGAMDANTASFDCVAVGYNALGASTTALRGNTAVGALCLDSVTTGYQNTAVGRNSGGDVTTGLNNIFLGNGAGQAAGNTSNRLYIDGTGGSAFPIITGTMSPTQSTDQTLTFNAVVTIPAVQSLNCLGASAFSKLMTLGFVGDQMIISSETSKSRQMSNGSSVLGTVYTTLGELCMWGITHNVGITGTATLDFLGRDQAEKCQWFCLTDSGLFKFFSAPTAAAGVVPAWVLGCTIDPDIGYIALKGGVRVQEVANGKQGLATLVAGTVVVANTSITANSRIFLTAQENGINLGNLRVSARVVGASFTILSSAIGDTCDVAYEIFEPG